MHRLRRHAALLAGLLLLCALAGCGSFSFPGFLHSINPLTWLGFDTPGVDANLPGDLINDPTGLLGTLGWLSRVTCILGVIALVVGAILRSLGVVLAGVIGLGVGIGVGLARGAIAKHPYLVYACYGVGAVAIVAKFYFAGAKVSAASAAGVPVLNNPFGRKANAQGSDLRRPLRPAGVPVPAPGSIGSGGDGSDGSGTVGF